MKIQVYLAVLAAIIFASLAFAEDGTVESVFPQTTTGPAAEPVAVVTDVSTDVAVDVATSPEVWPPAPTAPPATTPAATVTAPPVTTPKPVVLGTTPYYQTREAHDVAARKVLSGSGDVAFNSVRTKVLYVNGRKVVVGPGGRIVYEQTTTTGRQPRGKRSTAGQTSPSVAAQIKRGLSSLLQQADSRLDQLEKAVFGLEDKPDQGLTKRMAKAEDDIITLQKDMYGYTNQKGEVVLGVKEASATALNVANQAAVTANEAQASVKGARRIAMLAALILLIFLAVQLVGWILRRRRRAAEEPEEIEEMELPTHTTTTRTVETETAAPPPLDPEEVTV